ncbi:MAG: hypothetical protein JXA20_19090 [Spirochaetes bacterium]|nr:hypothetical protein [Spirochaetota bacterium]
MRGAITIAFFAALAISVSVSADDEQSTYPYVSVALTGRYYFKMLPAEKGYYDHDAGTGIMCTLSRQGTEKELWRTGGWYAFRTYPSYDGECLVRIGNWPRGRRPAKDHLAVAFYKRGVLMKRYSTSDLIKENARVLPSVSHYEFLASVPGFSDFNYDFSLITVDRVHYRFNACTGEIIGWKRREHSGDTR